MIRNGHGGGSSPASQPAPMTTSQIILWLSGDPKGKDRPKFNRVTGNVYTPRATEMAENDIRSAWREAGEPRLPDDAPLGIEVTLYYSRPQGHFKKDGSLSAEGLRKSRPFTKKPDVDNAMKLVMDALNSRAYRDDVRICDGHVEKHWAEWPATKIRIYSLDQTSRLESHRRDEEEDLEGTS